MDFFGRVREMLHPIWKKDTAALLFLRDSRAFFHKVAWRGKITKTCPSGLGKCWQRTGMKLSYTKLLQSSSAYSITLSIMGSYMDAVLVPDGYHPRTTTSSLLGTKTLAVYSNLYLLSHLQPQHGQSLPSPTCPGSWQWLSNVARLPFSYT